MIAVSCRLRDARGDLLVPYYRTVSRGPACRAVYIICRVISRVIAVKAACPLSLSAPSWRVWPKIKRCLSYGARCAGAPPDGCEIQRCVWGVWLGRRRPPSKYFEVLALSAVVASWRAALRAAPFARRSDSVRLHTPAAQLRASHARRRSADQEEV